MACTLYDLVMELKWQQSSTEKNMNELSKLQADYTQIKKEILR